MPCGLRRGSQSVPKGRPEGFQKDGPKGSKRGARSVEKGVGKVGFVGDYRVGRFWVGLGMTWTGLDTLAGRGISYCCRLSSSM